MSRTPSRLLGSPQRLVHTVMAGCQLRQAVVTGARPRVVVEPLQFRAVRRDQYGLDRVVRS